MASLLGGKHRMNLPGTPEGNWSWRIKEGKLNEKVAERLAALVKKYGR